METESAHPRGTVGLYTPTYSRQLLFTQTTAASVQGAI